MNSACPRRVSLIIALGLPAIPSPTIGATTGDRPAARRFGSPPRVRFAGFVSHSKTRPPTPTESSSRQWSPRTTCITDWSFSFRCSPPRLAATQLRFDTARFFTAQEQTSTALSTRLLRRTSAPVLGRSSVKMPKALGRLDRGGSARRHRFGSRGAPVMRKPVIACALGSGGNVRPRRLLPLLHDLMEERAGERRRCSRRVSSLRDRLVQTQRSGRELAWYPSVSAFSFSSFRISGFQLFSFLDCLTPSAFALSQF